MKENHSGVQNHKSFIHIHSLFTHLRLSTPLLVKLCRNPTCIANIHAFTIRDDAAIGIFMFTAIQSKQKNI